MTGVQTCALPIFNMPQANMTITGHFNYDSLYHRDEYPLVGGATVKCIKP